MPILLVLAAGLTIVIVGILVFRLHAFVALVLAGLTVAVLTPATQVSRSAQMEKIVRQTIFNTDATQVMVTEELSSPIDFIVVQDITAWTQLQQVGRVTGELSASAWTGETSLTVTEGSPACYSIKLDSGSSTGQADSLHLISAKDFAAAEQLASASFTSRFTTALGSYCGNLAILIVSASIIGRCLLDSGAADRIVKSTLILLGEKMAPAAFVVSGFTLGIPVFFDTVFYLMIPLGKALRLRTGGNYLLYVLAIVVGGTMAHSLVPPTPGPLFIAEEFEVSIASMIVGGCIVGLVSASVGMLFALWANKKFELPLRDMDDLKAQQSSAEDDTSQPGLVASLIPILLPVILITLGALLIKEADSWRLWTFTVSDSVAGVIKTLSEKNLALLISAIYAVALYVYFKRPSRDTLSSSLQHAVSSAGVIILVTAAGGAFGRMMRQTSVAELLQDLPSASPIMVVVAAFLVTTAVRTAQGSATVAMMTAAGIFGGLVANGAAGVHPLYVALAVGCGSKPIAWMNDSGFWVITRMSGMTESEGLKYVTPMTALAGVAGLVTVIIGMQIFPLM